MRDAETIKKTKEFFLAKFQDKKSGLSEQQLNLLDKIILRAAKDDVVLYIEEDKYINFILKNIRLLQPTVTDDDITRYSESVWHTIDWNRKRETEYQKALYAQNAHDFRNDNVPLHQHDNKKRMELNNDYLTCLMPESTPSFQVLTPLRIDQLSSINLNECYSKKPKVESILLPVGPGHWRALDIKKEAKDGKDHLTVTIFDSFGENSAKGILSSVTEWLEQQSGFSYKIEYAKFPNKQTDQFSCGDYVVAFAHHCAQKMELPCDEKILHAFKKMRALRPVMIAKSQALTTGTPHPVAPSESKKSRATTDIVKKDSVREVEPAKNCSKWRALREDLEKECEQKQQEILNKTPEEKEKTGQRVISYETSKSKVIQVDEKTQIELDELFAKELQAQEDESPRRGPR